MKAQKQIQIQIQIQRKKYKERNKHSPYNHNHHHLLRSSRQTMSKHSLSSKGRTCTSRSSWPLFKIFTALLVIASWTTGTSEVVVEATPLEVEDSKVKTEAKANANANAPPEVCTYDYKIIQRVGNTTYDGLPIKILRQAGDGTVDFVVGNTWTVLGGGNATNNATNDEVDAMYIISNSRADGSKTCYADTKVKARKSINSSLQAYCTRAGVATVRLYVSDKVYFSNVTDTARVPDGCPVVNANANANGDESAPGVEYIAVLKCTPTCEENHVPNPDPFEIDYGGPGPDNVIPLTCPIIGDDPLVVAGEDWNDGDIAEIDVYAGQDVLCTLIEMDVDTSNDDNVTTVFSNLKPVGRSYNGYDWEVAAGDFSTFQFDCSTSGGRKCRIELPTPPEGRSYVLKSYDYGHALKTDDLTARFLEKATFGPTKADIKGFTSPEDWVSYFSFLMIYNRVEMMPANKGDRVNDKLRTPNVIYTLFLSLIIFSFIFS